jgi:hypothetical protein
MGDGGKRREESGEQRVVKAKRKRRESGEQRVVKAGKKRTDTVVRNSLIRCGGNRAMIMRGNPITD